MQRFMYSVLVAVALTVWATEVAVGAVATQGGPEAGPVIEARPLTLDMGLISNEAGARGTITLRNVGKAPLLIERVKSSCSCTVGRLEKSELDPGEATALSITLIPAKIHGFTAKKSLLIHSNDPKNPILRIYVLAEIEPEYEIVPQSIDFGDVRKGQGATATLLVRQLDEESLEVTAVKKPLRQLPDVAFSVVKRPADLWTSPGKVEYEVTATLSPEAPAGPLDGRFYVVTNCARVPRLMCRVKGEITGSGLRRVTRWLSGLFGSEASQ